MDDIQQFNSITFYIININTLCSKKNEAPKFWL